jgi:hypothetical protein
VSTYFTPPIKLLIIHAPWVVGVQLLTIKLDNVYRVSNGCLRPPGWQYQLFVS